METSLLHAFAKKKFPQQDQTRIILIGILHLIGLLFLCNDADQIKRGRPYVYPTTVILRCFVMRIWFRIPSNNALHHFLSLDTTHHKIIQSCGLHSMPDRRTFDRRFKVLPISHMIGMMGQRFIAENLVDTDVGAADSTIIPCKKVWHKSDMKQNRIPISGIDADARWGHSKARGWKFGYKLHLGCSTGKLVVPLTACITTANVYDPQMFDVLIEYIAGLLECMAADSIYSGQDTYDICRQKGMVVCPIRRYHHTSGERLARYRFFKSSKWQSIIRRRGAIERLFDRTKDTFGIEPLPVRGNG